MIKERPILMCGDMVRATLEGRKSQTRRVVKPQPTFSAASGDSFEWHGGKALVAAGYRAPYVHSNWTAVENAMRKICPYGQPSDRLYVKEASWIWCEKRKDGLTKTGRQKYRYIPVGQHVVYCADQPKPVKPLDDDPNHCWRWKSGRFMPKWASRITLEIVSVRVERLQEITEEDAKAEGVDEEKYAVHYYCDEGDPDAPEDFGVHRCNWRFGFKMLWDSLNAKTHPWASNPWVWVIEFNKLNRI